MIMVYGSENKEIKQLKRQKRAAEETKKSRSQDSPEPEGGIDNRTIVSSLSLY